MEVEQIRTIFEKMNLTDCIPIVKKFVRVYNHQIKKKKNKEKYFYVNSPISVREHFRAFDKVLKVDLFLEKKSFFSDFEIQYLKDIILIDYNKGKFNESFFINKIYKYKYNLKNSDFYFNLEVEFDFDMLNILIVPEINAEKEILDMYYDNLYDLSIYFN